MSSFTPTPEQTAIVDFAKSRSENLIISAYAGAAKTSTLALICEALSGTPILSLAFNKRIADEMATRLPGHVKAMTLNSLGHRAWATQVSGRLVLDKDKSYFLLKEHIASLPKSRASEIWETYPEIQAALRAAVQNGYIPDSHVMSEKSLISTDDFYASLETEPEPWLPDLVDSIISERIHHAFAGRIDFDDQIYMPTLFGGQLPSFPLVCVDEVQDLSALNHVLIRRLARTRLIAVGDPNQSIYGFRGSVTDGMSALQREFAMEQLKLSVSFRCPRSVVERARAHVPDMSYPDWAIPGLVQQHDGWHAEDIPDGTAIICRNNAPLYKLAFALIRAGRSVQIVGSDIGPQLVKALRKLGDPSMSQAAAHDAVNEWEIAHVKKSRTKTSAHDRADCLRVFVDQGPTLSAAIAYAERLFAARGSIQLLSGHKAKGLEWDTVFHLDPWRVPSPFAKGEESLRQENNVKYVIETRPKRELHLVDLNNFGG